MSGLGLKEKRGRKTRQITMNFVRSFMGRLRKADLSNPRLLQHEIDTLKVFLLLEHRRRVLAEELSSMEILDEWSKDFDFEKQQSVVQDRVQQQALHLLRQLHECSASPQAGADDGDDDGKSNSSTIPQAGGHEEEEELSPDSFPLLRPTQRDLVSQHFVRVRDMLQDRVGFVPVVERSNLPAAGNGVFLKGRAVAGTVVSFYPGMVYLREHVQSGIYDHCFDSNAYVFSRFDSAVLDGSKPVAKHNPFAVGHIINHPSALAPGKEKAEILGDCNVIACPINFVSEIFDDEVLPHVPNAYDRPPTLMSSETARDSFALGTVLVAVRDIEDEELFLNYRYNPKIVAPPWYVEVSSEESTRRWS